MGGTVVFQPGQTEATVPVVVRGDEDLEFDELVVLSFRAPGNALMGGFWGLGFATITSDDGAPLPTITAGDNPQVLEGDSGTTPVAIPLFLSHASSQEVTVKWRVWLSGTPFSTSGVDYTPTSGTVTFPPGTTEAFLDLEVIGDTEVEDTELIALELHSPTNAVFPSPPPFPGRPVAGANIIDDD